MFRHVRNLARNFALSALAAASLLGAGNAQAAFPERPITLIVPWAAGGGTDAVARQIAHMLERDLKQPVNVVNRTGGSGVVGHQAIATAAPDGYTFGLITLEINLMHWVGLTDLTFEKYTPLALVNQDPAAIHVKADSPHKTVKELFAHIKANPNKVVASGTGQGGSWHLALAGLMQADGVSPELDPLGAVHGCCDRADRSGGRRRRLRRVLDAGSRGAAQGGAYPQPRVLLTQARAELP